MLNLQLHIQPKTEHLLKKIMTYIRDQEIFARNIIAYQIAELQKGILNLRLDLKQFEETYQMTTEKFYQQFEQGLSDDNEDFMIWAGLYEMLCENERRLRELT
ncbi:MAG: hypothetical protein BWK80_10605 [Desulfobacteraceae bacterium IS3]|jgi:uncharacterized lipoprotein NlpE involved in copper resistance|nr:MAG: hypothetical protein BWK80_10605 [Desulfobacteraceae bacterium IS3]HAO19028.1 hypothetical protein [Desulfobacteraceae bacterium]